jgi:hypothetical protein
VGGRLTRALATLACTLGALAVAASIAAAAWESGYSPGAVGFPGCRMLGFTCVPLDAGAPTAQAAAPASPDQAGTGWAGPGGWKTGLPAPPTPTRPAASPGALHPSGGAGAPRSSVVSLDDQDSPPSHLPSSTADAADTPGAGSAAGASTTSPLLRAQTSSATKPAPEGPRAAQPRGKGQTQRALEAELRPASHEPSHTAPWHVPGPATSPVSSSAASSVSPPAIPPATPSTILPATPSGNPGPAAQAATPAQGRPPVSPPGTGPPDDVRAVGSEKDPGALGEARG